MGLIPIQEEPRKARWRLNSNAHETEKLSPGAIGRLVEASGEIQSESKSRQQLYGCVERLQVQWE